MLEPVFPRHVTGSDSAFSIQHFPFFNWRMRSLLRATVLVFIGIPLMLMRTHIPGSTLSPIIVLPVLLTVIGTVDTARCMRKRRDFYHAGVLLLLYADLMAFFLVSFLLFSPYLPTFGR